MIGGGGTHPSSLKNTEILDLDGTSKYGPSLPWKFYGHCAVMMSATYVILVGGTFRPKSTLIVDVFNFEAKFEGPKLLGGGRSGAACAHIVHNNGSNYVIVAGGDRHTTSEPLDTTEILIVNEYDISQSKWITGRY